MGETDLNNIDAILETAVYVFSELTTTKNTFFALAVMYPNKDGEQNLLVYPLETVPMAGPTLGEEPLFATTLNNTLLQRILRDEFEERPDNGILDTFVVKFEEAKNGHGPCLCHLGDYLPGRNRAQDKFVLDTKKRRYSVPCEAEL